MLNQDDRTRVLACLQKTTQTCQFLADMLDSQDAMENGLSLCESYIADVSKIVGFNGTTRRNKEMTIHLAQQQNLKIKELEEKLSSGTPLMGLTEKINEIGKALRFFWENECGFGNIACAMTAKFSDRFGAELTFSLMFDTVDDLEDKPATKKQFIAAMKEKYTQDGLQIIDNRIADTAEAKHYIKNMIKGKFPTFRVFKWHSLEWHGVPILESLNGHLNLDDLVNLIK